MIVCVSETETDFAFGQPKEVKRRNLGNYMRIHLNHSVDERQNIEKQRKSSLEHHPNDA